MKQLWARQVWLTTAVFLFGCGDSCRQPVGNKQTQCPDVRPGALVAEVFLDRIELSWGAAQSVDGYSVQRKPMDGQWSELALVGSATAQFSDEDIELDTYYDYLVQGVRKGCHPQGVDQRVYTLGAPVGNFSASVESPTVVALTWNNPNQMSSGFRLERQQQQQGFALVQETMAPDSWQYRDGGLEENTEYIYRLYAQNQDHLSGEYAEVEVRTSHPPNLSWGVAPAFGENCELLVSGDASFDVSNQVTFGSATGSMAHGVDDLVAYQFGLRATLVDKVETRFATSWTVVDSLGASTTLQRDLSLSFSSAATRKTAVALPSREIFQDGMEGRQTIFYSALPPNACMQCQSIRGSLALGGHHTCLVTTQGGIKCSGYNINSQLGDGTQSSRQSPVEVCASGAGGLCSGGFVYTGAQALASGGYHNCVLSDAGQVQCWGANGQGQLGDGSREEREHPTFVCREGVGCLATLRLSDAVALAAGSDHSCALLSSGQVACWGRNGHGQLANGGALQVSNPLPVCISGNSQAGNCVPLERVIAIVGGGLHGCALLEDQTVRCWGGNGAGQLGDGTSGDNRFIAVPVCAQGSFADDCNGGDVLRDVVALAAGDIHTCALDSLGGVKCWGDNNYGALGIGVSGPARHLPVDVCVSGSVDNNCNNGDVLTDVVAIAAGGSHSCALLSDGSLRCWGLNNDGQLGDGTNGGLPCGAVGLDAICRFNPQTVCAQGSATTCVPLSNMVGINTGSYHSCALDEQHGAWCWGRNNFGQLGSGDDNPSRNPAVVCHESNQGRCDQPLADSALRTCHDMRVSVAP